jgi:sec-independent protein translocase protein TatC
VAPTDDTPRPLTEHLDELRRRLFWVLGTWIVAFLLAFSFADEVFEILMGPAVSAVRGAGLRLQAISPPEEFVTWLKTSLLAGFMACLPMTLYQGWAFVAPGLYQNEKRLAAPFVIATTGLFFGGDAFGYYLAFPFIFDFFLNFGPDYVENAWTTQAVFSFMCRLYLAFGMAFQLPIVMVFLAGAGIVTPEQMARSRPYAIVCMFVAGAILTPPDVVSQVMLAVPMALLYEVGLLVSRMAARSVTKTAETAASQQPEASA